MIKKGLLRKGMDGKYYPKVSEWDIVFRRIDRRRVRIKRLDENIRDRGRLEKSILEKHPREPYAARLAFRRAQKLAQRYGVLTVAYFLVYSLVGARMTGYLLVWFNNVFVYCEEKTGFCHYFYSELLRHYFIVLGLGEGIMYRYTDEYEEAAKIASRYVRKYYGGHQSSRRLHYMLKKEGYIEYGDEVYNIEIFHYDDGDIGVRIWDNDMDVIIYEENVIDETIEDKEIKPAYPYEHIYEPNEETYFHNLPRLY